MKRTIFSAASAVCFLCFCLLLSSCDDGCVTTDDGADSATALVEVSRVPDASSTPADDTSSTPEDTSSAPDETTSETPTTDTSFDTSFPNTPEPDGTKRY